MDSERKNKHLVFETAFGLCAVIFRDGPFRALHVLLPADDEKALAARIDDDTWGVEGSHPRAKAMSEAIADYFEGNVPEIQWPPWEWLDFGGLTDLEKEVLFETAKIPPGRTLSYKELAEAVRRPRAYRFVGATMAKNPFPIMIPCHRVIKSDGRVGKFGGGSEMKRKMIDLESPLALAQSTCKQ